jgi:endonuclease/exonuclease/phosphatase family metal-dependent hydrolase
VILSEAPPDAWVDQLVRDLGPGASCARVEHERGRRYEYGMAVCSRWLVRLEEAVPLPNGKGMSVVADVNGCHLRLFVVDGLSNPFRSRLPFLQAIVAACRVARDADRPFDLIVGDFNTPSQSLGLDGLAVEGYTLASRSAAGWRATFPSWLPIYDIDHVWLTRGLRVGSAWCFNGAHSDHRGQVAHLLVPQVSVP